MKFKGLTAIVTGGNGGIGRAMARAFAGQGAMVCVADTAPVPADFLGELGGNSFAIDFDVTNRDSIENLLADVTSRTGGVDILINNAGVHSTQPFLEVDESEFERIFAVNSRGYFFMMQAVARKMIMQGRGGKIVNISSGAGRRGTTMSPVYSASKAAAISLNQSAAQSLMAYGINVNSIAPGGIDTPMLAEVVADLRSRAMLQPNEESDALVAHIPAKRLGTPNDLVGVAMFLCSHEASYVVGQTWNVDGGFLLN